MSSPPPPETLKTLILNFLSRFRTSILRLIPSSSDVPGILARSSSLYTPGYPTKSRRRKPGLPLPLRSGSLLSIPDISETSRIIGVLDDVLEHILCSMHKIQKSLQFWQSRGEGKDVQKVYFMVFERGPRAFIDETIQLISRCAKEGPSLQHLCHSAATLIAEKISALSSLQYCLASFVSQVYVEVSKHEDLISKDPDKAFPLLLVAIDSLFSRLEVSILSCEELLKTDSHASLFETLPEVDREVTEWRQADKRRAINMIYENIQRLDSYLSNLVSQYQRPRKITLHWLRYTGGAVGLSLCTVWLVRHSRLMGSSDIDDWFQEAKESTLAFWNSRVEEPILSIRDELFEAFGRRHKGGVIEIEEVKLTADSLHRMLLAFTEQTKGQEIPENASDQELLEIVMFRYEKEVMHPIQNLFSGEIARALLIQIQKLKLDLETAMLELDQILKANEINFAILAALPAFFLSVSLLMLVRAWVLQDKGAEGRGRRARLQRRLLVAEIEKKILHLQTCRDRDLEEDAQWTFGMVLYYLDRLYKAAESHARDTGEWLSLRQDILDIGNPGMAIEHKLVLASRMEILYECMLPSLKRF